MDPPCVAGMMCYCQTSAHEGYTKSPPLTPLRALHDEQQKVLKNPSLAAHFLPVVAFD